MSFLGEVLVTMLAALLGAWGGARAALTRFKEERAFDRRLEWYHETVQALWEAKWKLDYHATKIEHGPGGISKISLQEIIEVVTRAMGFAVEGRMVAKEISSKELNMARKRLTEAYGKERIDTAEFVERLRSTAFDMENAARKLAEHGREHLAFKPLEERSRWSRVKMHASGLVTALLPGSR